MSPFALIFPKKPAFAAGANPVIYGLTDRNYWPPSGKGGGPRVINPSILSELEQYRYVTYNPASSTPIDWSHEREWRWPYRGDFSSVENAIEEFGMIDDAMDIPGFDFYLEEIKGIGVVVNNRIQANWIAHDILMLVDKGVIDKDTFQFILASDELPSSEELVSPVDTSNAISGSLIDLKPFFSHMKNDLDEIAKEFTDMVESIENNASEPKSGEIGGCWLWLLDNTNIFTRALISHSRVIISDSGKYLVQLYEFSDSRSLREREEMTQELAKIINKQFGVECGYFSVLNSDNPNDVPFYNSDHLDNHMHYNVSWEH